MPLHLGAQCSDKILMHINRSVRVFSKIAEVVNFSGQVISNRPLSTVLRISTMDSTLMSPLCLMMETG